MDMDLMGCDTPRRTNDQLAIKEAAAACLHSLELLVSSHSSVPSEAPQQQEQQLQQFGEIAHQAACKIRKMLSLLNRTSHARFRRGPIEPPPSSHAPVMPPPPPPTSLTFIAPLSVAPTFQPQSLTLEVMKPNLSISGATMMTPMPFFSSVIGGGRSRSLGQSQLSAGKPPLSRHKRKPCAGANSEATTNGTQCQCSKRMKNTVKRTIRVPAVSTKIADIPLDEYSWWKYGQKSIKAPLTHGATTSAGCDGLPGEEARRACERRPGDARGDLQGRAPQHTETPSPAACAEADAHGRCRS